MVYRCKLLPGAQSDLDASLSWYGKQGGVELAQKFFNDYRKIRQLICENADWPYLKHGKFRSIRLQQFPFKIIYRLQAELVIIVAIAHDKRKPDYWKHRTNH